MAAASYTTDLVTITTSDNDAAPIPFSKFSGYNGGKTPAIETDYYIQGAACISNTSNYVGLGSIGAVDPTPRVVPVDGAVFIWAWFGAPNALDTQAGTVPGNGGGLQIFLGDTAADFMSYNVAGSDTYIYGGWVCYPVDPRVTPQLTVGAPVNAPTGTVTSFGVGVHLVNNVFKGNPIAIDAIRFGRGALEVTGGDLANGYANFADAALFNDHNDATNGFNRYGLFQYNQGTYLQQGKFQMGTATTPVEFTDYNRSIVIANTEFVQPGFNVFEINNAASIINWTGIGIVSLGTVSPGSLVINDNPVVNLSACTFTGMGAFTFDTNTTVEGTAFSQCGLITQNGASITGSTIGASTAPSAIIDPDFATFTNNSMVGGGAGHGIELTQAGSYGFNNISFDAFGADETVTAGVYNNSGGAITITVIGGDIPTVRNSPGSTTTIISGALVTLTGLKPDSEVRAYVGTNPATATELAGTESSGTSFQFAHNVGGQAGFITIFHLQYQAIYLSLTYSTSDVSFPISQVFDRQYI